MKSFYKTKEDMSEDFIENEQDVVMRETFNDSPKKITSISKNTMIKLGIVFLIIFIIIAVGGIKVPQRKLYDMQFDFSITDVDVRTTVHTEYKKTYIPFMLYSVADVFARYNYDTLEKGEDYNKLTGMGVYLLKVTAYKCHYINDDVNVKIGCGGQNPDFSLVTNPRAITRVESRNAKYTGLKIIDRGHDNKVMYDGKLIQDISEYIYKPSIYAIFVYAEYDNTKATVSTTIEVKDE